MDSRSRARMAAATGLLFAAAVVATGVISEMKDFDRAGDLVLQASNEVYGTTTLLTGFAAVFFFAFASTLAARIRQLEGGSGRLAAAVNASGAIISGTLALSVGVAYAARSTGSADLAALLTGLLDGPALFFPAAVFLGAGSTVALRTASIPNYSMWTARLIFPLSLAYLAFGGLQLFKNYAWINETGYISFAVAVAITSLIGINRWGEMDGTTPSQRRAASAPAPAAAPAAPAKRKPAKRKPARKR